MKDRDIDIIHGFVDYYLCQGRMEFINEMLKSLYRMVADLELDEVLTWLTVCHPARNRLTEYEVLLRAAKIQFKKDDESGQLFIGL